MEPVAEHRDVERVRWDFFQSIPPLDRDLLAARHGQGHRRCSSRCSSSRAPARGCGETPYLRLVTPAVRRPDDRRQRDRLLVDLRRQPADDAVDRRTRDGRGPAWSNSLFEDNAEFGLGMRLALDAQTDQARRLLERLAPERRRRPRARASSTAPRTTEAEIVRAARARRRGCASALARDRRPARRATPGTSLALAGDLVRQGVWIIGGDGWAYDIGFGGLDHVLSSGRNVNILVLDTEVYSNTGGQASKATPRGAVAKFAAAGKGTGKKDLGAIARAYGNVYVAQVSMGANDLQTTKALARGRRVAGPVAGHRLQHVHRPRHRHVEVDDATRRTRSRAATGRSTASSRPRSRTASRSSSTRTTPSIPIARLRRDRDPLRGPRAHPPGTGRRARGAGPGRRRRALALLRAARRRSSAPFRTCTDDPTIVPDVESDAGYRYDDEDGA